MYYFCESEKILEVAPDSFIPEPEVTSEVIKLNLRQKPPIETKNAQKMFSIIKVAFMQRRKTLLNALTNGNIFNNKKDGIEAFKNLNISQNVRAEELTLKQFAELTDYLINKEKS